MEKIARALGKKYRIFFGTDSIEHSAGRMSSAPNKIAFYAGEPSKKQEQIANQLMELMENIDEVLSAKQSI